MTTVEAIETLGKRWKSLSVIGFLVIGSAFWIADQTSGLAASEKKNSSQDEMIQSNNELLKVMSVKIDGISDYLGLILQLYGIDPSKVNRWKLIPANPVIDTVTGFPAIGSQWLRMNDSRQVGWLYKATEDSVTGDLSIDAVILWDLTEK